MNSNSEEQQKKIILEMFSIREIVMHLVIHSNVIKIVHFDKNGEIIAIVLHEGNEKIVFKSKDGNINNNRRNDLIRKMLSN